MLKTRLIDKQIELYSPLFKGGVSELLWLESFYKSLRFRRLYPSVGFFYFPSRLATLLSLSQDGEVWTRVKLPENIKPFYLVSNKGNVFSFAINNLKSLHPIPYRQNEMNFRLSQTGKKFNFIIPQQRLFALNWKDEIPTSILGDLSSYSVVHIDHDPTDFTLDNFVFIRNYKRGSLSPRQVSIFKQHLHSGYIDPQITKSLSIPPNLRSDIISKRKYKNIPADLSTIM